MLRKASVASLAGHLAPGIGARRTTVSQHGLRLDSSKGRLPSTGNPSSRKRQSHDTERHTRQTYIRRHSRLQFEVSRFAKARIPICEFVFGEEDEAFVESVDLVTESNINSWATEDMDLPDSPRRRTTVTEDRLCPRSGFADCATPKWMFVC